MNVTRNTLRKQFEKQVYIPTAHAEQHLDIGFNLYRENYVVHKLVETALWKANIVKTKTLTVMTLDTSSFVRRGRFNVWKATDGTCSRTYKVLQEITREGVFYDIFVLSDKNKPEYVGTSQAVYIKVVVRPSPIQPYSKTEPELELEPEVPMQEEIKAESDPFVQIDLVEEPLDDPPISHALGEGVTDNEDTVSSGDVTYSETGTEIEYEWPPFQSKT